MRKKYIIIVTALVAPDLGTTACFNSSSDQATSKRVGKLGKTIDETDKEDKKKSNAQSSSRFTGDTFKINKGSIKIEKLTEATPKNTAPDDDVHYITIDALFTNKAKGGVTPEDSFVGNLKVEQRLSKSTHEVDGERSQFRDDLTPWKDKISAESDKVGPGRAVQLAMSFQLGIGGDDKSVNTCLPRSWNSDTMSSYDKPLDFKVSAT